MLALVYQVKLETALSETESFIEEVTEEVRRDKLYAMFRKYGWIAVVAVVLIVGAAAYSEWRKATTLADARALGDNIMVALESTEADDRAAALAVLDSSNDNAKTFLTMIEAAARSEASDKPAALALLDQVAGNAEAPDTYRQLASLKALILRGADQDRETRLAILDDLAIAGRPFRVLAMEQKALALYEFGENDAAIALLHEILEEPDATQGLILRAQQLIVALGGSLDNAGAGSSNG